MLPLKWFKSLTSNYRPYHKVSVYFPVLEVTCDMGSTLQASTVIPVAMDLWIKGKSVFITLFPVGQQELARSKHLVTFTKCGGQESAHPLMRIFITC